MAESNEALAIYAIRQERKKQRTKWGEQNHGDLYWLAILMEEVGEAAQAIIQEKAYDEVEKEMVQIGAVVVAWLECHARFTGAPFPIDKRGFMGPGGLYDSAR